MDIQLSVINYSIQMISKLVVLQTFISSDVPADRLTLTTYVDTGYSTWNGT